MPDASTNSAIPITIPPTVLTTRPKTISAALAKAMATEEHYRRKVQCAGALLTILSFVFLWFFLYIQLYSISEICPLGDIYEDDQGCNTCVCDLISGVTRCTNFSCAVAAAPLPTNLPGIALI